MYYERKWKRVSKVTKGTTRSELLRLETLFRIHIPEASLKGLE